MSDLFSLNQIKNAPLAERLRPKDFSSYVGQSHLIGQGQLITEICKADTLPSLILWGPPGSGKTTLANLLASQINAKFMALSAVTSGIKDIKEVVEQAQDDAKLYSKKTILFVDEIHRFNKAQQDALLPHVEKGTIILVGATTENPSFEVIAPLLSRARVVVLKKLTHEEISLIIKNGLTQYSIGISPEANTFLCDYADGDARRALNTLELAFELVKSQNKKTLELKDIELASQNKALLYDKKGEEHYNTISAFIKSMRDSDPDAAVYYLARMLEAGEAPLFVARRMVIFASEDIGNANPQAVTLAISCMQSLDFVGMPEGWIPMAQCATYLASSPKSNASYMAYKSAKADVYQYGSLPIPMVIRNAPTKMMKEMGYGANYQYAHDQADHIAHQQHLPDALKNKKYYFPTDIGYEKKLKEYLDYVKNKK